MCSKQVPFHALLPLLRHVVPLNDGNCRLTIPVVKGCCTHDTLPHAFHISVFEFVKTIYPVWQNKNHSIFNIHLGSRAIKLPVTFHGNFNILSWGFQASWYFGMRHPSENMLTSWRENTLHIIIPLLSTFTSGFPSNGAVMWSFYVFLVVSLNEMLNKQSMCQWLLMPWSSL